LREIYDKYALSEKGVGDFRQFLGTYRAINKDLWYQYKEEKITKAYLKTERFYRTLKYFGVDDSKTAEDIGTDYLKISPTKTLLFPHAIEILEYLKPGYRLHILTNGFNEVQFSKLKNSGMAAYFDQVITSEMAGSKKPAAQIFQFALQKIAAEAPEVVMIGDDPEADIKGAMQVGIDQIYVNYYGNKNGIEPTYEVGQLREIEKIL
jgi:putative hydrolase of the HAD superfamily